MVKWVDKVFLWSVRALSIYLTFAWYEYVTKSDFTGAERYSLRNIFLFIPQEFAFFNLGLWLSYSSIDCISNDSRSTQICYVLDYDSYSLSLLFINEVAITHPDIRLADTRITDA